MKKLKLFFIIQEEKTQKNYFWAFQKWRTGKKVEKLLFGLSGVSDVRNKI